MQQIELYVSIWSPRINYSNAAQFIDIFWGTISRNIILGLKPNTIIKSRIYLIHLSTWMVTISLLAIGTIGTQWILKFVIELFVCITNKINPTVGTFDRDP